MKDATTCFETARGKSIAYIRISRVKNALQDGKDLSVLYVRCSDIEIVSRLK